MERKRSFPRIARTVLPVSLALFTLSLPGVSRGAPDAPRDGAPADAPRSRLTLRGEFSVDTFSQKDFFLGQGGTSGQSTDRNGFWAQNLLLQPRFIVSDDLNLNLSLDLAQGVWGLETGSTPGAIGPYPTNGSLSSIHLDWAYLAYRHEPTRTRWYLGRQSFQLGNLLVLDQDATGLQVYHDLPSWGASIGVGLAKALEAGGFSDANNRSEDGTRTGTDGRDADIVFVEWSSGGSQLALNPFFVYYQDRSGGDGFTLYPDRLPYANARFQPNVTRATAFGVALRLERGALAVDAEYDRLRGVDRIANSTFGPGQLRDVNNGDLTGSNLYVRASLGGPRLEIGGIFAQGSGDEDPRSGEGNLNRIRTDGNFFITEVWEDSIMPDRGYFPGGLGSPLSRGYRELENTRILQGFLAFHPSPNVRVFGSASLIRSVEDLRGWSDGNGDGVLSSDEFGTDLTRELGSEIDWRIDWNLDDRIEIAFRGGIFLPRVAAGYLLFGTGEFQESATELGLSVRVPIPEFSLGG